MIHLFGDRLKELRKENNITQEEIGALCNVAKQTISNWENNITQPPFKIVKILARHFNVSTDYLLGFNQEDYDQIGKLNMALREANLINSDETLKKEEIQLAVDQVRQYKRLWKEINDKPNKYPDMDTLAKINQSNSESTNE